MRRHLFPRCLLWFALLLVVGCRNEPSSGEPASSAGAATPKRFEKVRGPAVAGLFYPKSESRAEADGRPPAGPG